MRFSVAAVFAAVAAGVVAEEVSTVIVTETATYCPKSTDAIGVSPTESISIPAGYTTTRPLITSTVTECNKCSSTAPPAGTPTGVNPVGSSTPSSPVIPVVPVPSVPSSSKATPSPSSSSSIIKRPSSSSIVISSTPLVSTTHPASTNAPPAPSASGPSDVSPTGSATTPAVPLFTSGGSRAAVGAGAGLATVFGLAAVLL
ncbi:GPI anchored protein [Aspergillus nomiae NRRL 13137]|uniref:GPI anchored protein n=1 Tax=Aspergillus nomiae NRRL (strain ATCC 15546 / NRRL 13137 / CBS 260.88 / M93) TaxID=1509407 RepID=A0A0L1IQQ1_ASPN3|nr:GPI anchored protein [Aspergillus nomiae NRRL 13137]KNG81710.1 GPI anchored protein [Aspergillus nomiae NRRL 13137]